MNRFTTILAHIGRNVGVVVAVIGFGLLGFWLRGCGTEHAHREHLAASAGQDASMEEETRVWTCSMHPQIREKAPGLCRICGMALIPVESGSGGKAPVLEVSETARALMEIETRPVERRFVSVTTRMVGKVAYDETRVRRIAAWIPGRLDRLFVDYTGITVRQGDHMVEIYSPDLLSAQEELIQAVKAADELRRSDIPLVRESSRATVQAARDKLRLLGLTAEQVEQVMERGRPSDHITIYAPIGGVVVHKNATEGMYVQTGTPLYTIADLTHLWVNLEAYESDLSWLRYGQAATIATEAYPGEVFQGWISFIDPVVDPMTRTVRIRVNVPNPDLKLKPEMFVRGTVRSRPAQGGRVIEPDLSGKWICPMHPEVIEDHAAACPICGMGLVTAASLGFEPAADADPPLVIPASAPLITGKRAIVYLELEDTEVPTYEGREVTLGARAGDYYVVADGLSEGDMVVTRGNFKIDSALQIQARSSMMSPDMDVPERSHGHVPPPGRAHGMMEPVEPPRPRDQQPGTTESRTAVPAEFRSQLSGVWKAYLELHGALAVDNVDAIPDTVDRVRMQTEMVDPNLLSAEDRTRWQPVAQQMRDGIAAMDGGGDVDAVRKGFESLSASLEIAISRFGLEPSAAVHKLRCPMAFGGRGAYWLQGDQGVRNPYFGGMMPRCGEVVGSISTGGMGAGGHAHE
jgi:Cu(I)/Ag(I) efflux system membrane fusion protein